MVSTMGRNVHGIKTWLKLVRVGALAVLISGCASTVHEVKSYQSHEEGKQAIAKVGTPMLVSEAGTIEKDRRWVGLLNAPDGWETIATKYSDDFRRKELIYQGISGSTVKVTYRVFRAGSAMPEQQEILMFDLSESSTIQVKDFRLKVLEADADSISYMILKD